MWSLEVIIALNEKANKEYQSTMPKKAVVEAKTNKEKLALAAQSTK